MRGFRIKVEGSACADSGSRLRVQRYRGRSASSYWTHSLAHPPAHPPGRVQDNKDGTYRVDWKPTVSGTYIIGVSLFGIPLPKTPLHIAANSPVPCASKCIVRGDGLRNATSRTSHVFEVLFKDVLGQVAAAQDLDVFVEPFTQGSPRNRRVAQTAAVLDSDMGTAVSSLKKGKGAGTAALKAAALEAREREKREAAEAVVSKGEKKPKGGGGSKNDLSLNLAKVGKASSPRGGAKESQRHGEGTARGESGGGGGSTSRRLRLTSPGPSSRRQKEVAAKPSCKFIESKFRLMRIRVGDKPLIVRTTVELHSSPLGRLMPGQVVTIVEERLAVDGEVRACVALDSVALSIDGVRHSIDGVRSGAHDETIRPVIAAFKLSAYEEVRRLGCEHEAHD